MCSSSDSRATLYWTAHPRADTGHYIAQGDTQICGSFVDNQAVYNGRKYELKLHSLSMEMGMRYGCVEQTEAITNYAYAEVIVAAGMYII